MRYLAVVTYDGTNYVGWQTQPEGISIEGEIEKILSKILNVETKIFGSGRTDAGVHSHGQTFHFDAKEIIDLGKFTYSLNSLLPPDIRIKNIKKIDDDFNARYDVKNKTYIYCINIGEFDPFMRNYVHQINRELNLRNMEEALNAFKGKHCFQNFTSKDEDLNNFVRTIYFVNIIKEGNIIKIILNGNGFMRYMVRMIVGTIIEVGLGRLDLQEIEKMLNGNIRKICSYKAPANGLYLEEVAY